MPILFQKFISRSDLRSNPNRFYVFGDNDKRQGLGGQAKEMRGERNAIGIRTKASPSVFHSSYWYDSTYEQNKAKIDEDIAIIEKHLTVGKLVIFPSDGIGTGYAQLQEKAPNTYLYLQEKLEYLAGNYKEPDVQWVALVGKLKDGFQAIGPLSTNKEIDDALNSNYDPQLLTLQKEYQSEEYDDED